MHFLDAGLISLGAVIMAVAIILVLRLRRTASGRRGLGLQLGFMALFLVGYVGALSAVILGWNELLSRLTAAVFFGGAAFVAFTLRVTLTLTTQLQEINEHLEQRVTARTAELNDAESWARSLLNSTHDALVVVDEAGLVIEWNPAAIAIFGRSREEMLGAGLAGRVVPLELWQTLEQHLRCLAPGESACLRRTAQGTLALRASGERFEVELTLTLVARGPGRALALFVRDVAAARKLELELRASQKLESVGRLANGMAHEINSPVQFVTDSVTFARDSAADLFGLLRQYAALREAVAKGDSAGDLAQALVSAEAALDLEYLVTNVPRSLDLSLDGLGRVAAIVRSMKAFANPDQRHPSPADLNAAIRNTLTVASNEYKYIAELELDLAELPPVVCQLGEFNQVMLSVVVNAAHAIADKQKGGPQRGHIVVRSRSVPEGVVVSVADDGGGIPESVQDKVFDPFFTTKDVGRGTGQGLNVARSVMQRHGGSIRFETVPGVGTTFFITFPHELQAAAA